MGALQCMRRALCLGCAGRQALATRLDSLPCAASYWQRALAECSGPAPLCLQVEVEPEGGWDPKAAASLRWVDGKVRKGGWVCCWGWLPARKAW